MTARPVIIDCDPGVDDAVMLFLAFAAPDVLDIRAVTAVAGNVDAARTARNACVIREMAGREGVPVYAGLKRPMVRPPLEAEHFHGESGLGTMLFSAPRKGAEAEHAVNAIVRIAMAATAPVTVVITGPCTNVAMALLMEPRIADRIDEIVIMGGARTEGGNITASAEYNIYADPHAAHVVLGMAKKATVLGLDVTHTIRATKSRTAEIAALGGVRAEAIVNLLDFSSAATAAYGQGDGAPLHDPATIAWLLAPEHFTARPARIGVEMESVLTLGCTSVDFRVTADETNCRWVTDADADAVFALLRKRIAP